MRRRRYPLSIHITSLFLILTTFVGAVLISISYRHSQELLLGTVREVSNEHRDKLVALLPLGISFQKKMQALLSRKKFRVTF